MRGAITSIIFAGILAAGLFAALSAASRNPQPVPPTPGGITIVYPTVLPVTEAPAHPSYVWPSAKNALARYKYNKQGSRLIRCAGLVDVCFYNSPMGGTDRR
jgi:hypothetical protein